MALPHITTIVLVCGLGFVLASSIAIILWRALTRHVQSMPGCRVMLDHLDKTPLKDGKGRKSRKRCPSSVTFLKNMSSHKL